MFQMGPIALSIPPPTGMAFVRPRNEQLSRD
jgi:hypothetical protein